MNISAFPLGKPVNNKQNAENKSKVSFGCRVMAFAKANNITNEDDELRLSCLKNEDNSLKNESPIRIKKFGLFTVEDLFGLRKIGNISGWGIAGIKKDEETPVKLRGTKPAFMDKKFDSAVDEIVSRKPEVILAHIRAASEICNQVNENNCHPFTYKKWNFIHNGVVQGALSPKIQDKIQNNYAQALGDKPKGTTDSEASFYYFMGKLQEKYNTTDSKKIGIENVEKTFAESIYDLIQASDKKLKPLDGSVMGIKGELGIYPSCNFIASDGNTLMAFRRGSKLHLGMKMLSNGEKEYVVSSEPVALKNKEMQWLDIPQNHMVVLNKDDKGNFIPEIHPLSKFIPGKVI